MTRTRGGRLAVLVLVAGVLGAAAGWWFHKEPLSAFQKGVLRPRVDRFADRYLPTLSGAERAEIVQSAYVARRISHLNTFYFLVGGSLLALAARAAARWHQERRRVSARNRAREWLSATLALALVASLLGSWKRLRSVAAAMEVAGGWTDQGRIVLSKANQGLIHDQDQLTLVFDHELTHLFGQSKYRQIQRDAWLSYAYPAVLALERGGFPLLQRAEAIEGPSERYYLYWFTEGVRCAAGAFPPADPEAELLKQLSRKAPHLKGPMNPDAASDSPEVPGADVNRIFDYGLAGIAWWLSGGKGEVALSYLDDRSHGIPPLQARERAVERGRFAAQTAQALYFLRQSEILTEAEQYRLALWKEGEEKERKDRPVGSAHTSNSSK